ncbi:MAG: adenylate/guanylate cyclase domain-containing protein [Bacteroidota bacterium]
MSVTKRFLETFFRPTDSVSDKINKSVLLATVAFKCGGCVVWFVLYYSLGFALAWKFPIVYLVLLIGTAYYLKRTNNFLTALNFYLAYILILPVVLQVTLGGFINSGAVVIWAFLAPTGALFFKGRKQGTIWFILFVIGMIIGAILETYITGQKENSPLTIILFFFMNISVVASFIFYTMTYYRELSSTARKTILSQKEMLQESHNQLSIQKKTIEQQHDLLESQHHDLILEQDRTQKVLHQVEKHFGQQVSKEVVEELLKEEGEVKSKLYHVAVMFLDIRDFTSFADSRDPMEVASFQNIVFGALIEVVRQNQGITTQILGDGIMAVFGAPVVSYSPENDAVKAGYEMIEKIQKLADDDKIPSIRVGIGIHAGKVIAGNIGNAYRKQYSLTGSTVIIASRIEQLNKVHKCQFLVSETVNNKIKDKYTTESIGKTKLKGIEELVEVYKLV